MPRRKRMYLPGYPYHIVQRGNNREACFIESKNYQFYLGLWKECCKRYGVDVHAYCLMTNHIHFLVTPDKPDSISRAMQVVGSRYGYYFNLNAIDLSINLIAYACNCLENPAIIFCEGFVDRIDRAGQPRLHQRAASTI